MTILSGKDKKMLEWDSSYEIGDEKIDAEHRIFFGLLVQFNEAANHGAPKEDLLRIMSFIDKYSEFHFASEEELMRRCQYPDQSQHAYFHNGMLSEIKGSITKFQHDKLRVVDVSKFLLDWFIKHILKDKEIAQFMRNSS